MLAGSDIGQKTKCVYQHVVMEYLNIQMSWIYKLVHYNKHMNAASIFTRFYQACSQRIMIRDKFSQVYSMNLEERCLGLGSGGP